jgi:hypothetical protein
MRRIGTYIAALSAAAARSFNRPSDRFVVHAAIVGCLSQAKPEQGLNIPD